MENTAKFKREQPDLSVIVVSYNIADLLGNCLKSVLVPDNIAKEVFVVDNASSDGSSDFIKDKFPSVHLIANTENRGFASANNQMLPRCKGKYIFFLNPDTEVMSDTFNEAISFIDANPRVGLAGTKIINPDGTLQWSVSYKYPGQKYTTNELSDLPGKIACVLGASMIARSEIIKKIGGFDEKFFLYGEDQDLCLRIRKLGYEIGYNDSAVVVHLGGRTERNFASSDTWRKKILAEYVFYKKHYLPETITKISRAHLVKACWRIATLNLTIPFMKDKARAKEKLIKYQVIYHTIKNFVHQLPR
ncbi:MAG: glycosyltransferase family 2 protein [Candidatus Desulfaltia sp.]|nr:glycosyltransferase family 2 protein [Candidatus Desulfaltia sp.]